MRPAGRVFETPDLLGVVDKYIPCHFFKLVIIKYFLM